MDARVDTHVLSREAGQYRVLVTAGGALRVEVGGESCLVESSFSFPGHTIGTNDLADREARGEAAWHPLIEERGENEIVVAASGGRYRLERRVVALEHRISICDTLINTSDADVGVIVVHRTTPSGAAAEVLLAGSPTRGVPECVEWGTAVNPSLYIKLAHGSLGLLVEDTISRLQWEGNAEGDRPTFSFRHFVLPGGKSHTFRWAAYPLHTDADYYSFINLVRRDWKTNFTIDGPFSFLDVLLHSEMLHEPAAVRAHLARKRLKIVALGPWLDYDNCDPRTGKPLDRDEFRTVMREATAVLKSADPEVRCIGCMEGSIVSPPRDLQLRLHDVLPPDRRQAGYPFLCTDEQMSILRDVDLRWKDCLLTAEDGRYYYELYHRGPRKDPFVGLLVYAAPGNGQLDYWFEQARFMMEDVGLDGIYIDQFSVAHDQRQRHSYDRWDGVTAFIDEKTGEIVRRCTDVALISVGAQRQLVEYVLSRGGTFVANTHSSVEEMQSYPISRFTESEGEFNPLVIRGGTDPVLQMRMGEGHLASPISLGYRPERLGPEGISNYAEVIMRSVITCLRHGQLYYHYVTEIPAEGRGSGEYGPINRMFPITPMELHAGWIVGKERIVTAVSGLYEWAGPDRPEVRLFDATGREAPCCCEISKEPEGWTVALKMRDWDEIAVIEGGSGAV